MTVERNIYDGRTLLGIVRKRSDGSFVVAMDEQILGAFDTSQQAIDALLELAGMRGAQCVR